MRKKKHREPRACVICGSIFVPKRVDIKTCGNPECKKKLQRKQQLAWYKANYASIQEKNRSQKKQIREEELKIREPHKPKPDTIVAIGYADRQRAETLKMVGRVKAEL
jgi:uncharacterized OB-fold protein